MSPGIFELFCEMITKLPAQAIPNALDLECKMLKDDVEHHRLDPSEDSLSIFSFRQFVRMAKLGHTMHCTKPLPPDHIEFYKKTIVRLIQSGELPQSAMEQFDYTFVSAVF